MSEVQRICPACNESAPLESQFCANCGYNFQSGLPMQQPSLPALFVKAALPVLAGAASLALRMGWKFLQNRLADAQNANQSAVSPTQTNIRKTENQHPVHQTNHPNGRRTVHIRSSWTVGDANGNWQQGSSEHTIEFDE